jgi:radical SAM-linked protein
MRFRKQADLRLISHRDLVRACERWFRRCGLQLGMSEGFHPKARMSFPLALSLGIASDDEVMEFELREHVDLEELRQRLAGHAPPGLEITDLQAVHQGERKAAVCSVTYRLPIPADRAERLRAAIEQFNDQDSCWIQRDDTDRAIDVRAGTDHLEFCDGNLIFRLPVLSAGSVRPREVLQALEVGDLEYEGHYLTRTKVEIAP